MAITWYKRAWLIVLSFFFLPTDERKKKTVKKKEVTNYIEFKNWNDTCCRLCTSTYIYYRFYNFHSLDYIARSWAKSEMFFSLKMVILLTKISTWGGARGNRFKVRGIWMVLKFLTYHLCHNILYRTHPVVHVIDIWHQILNPHSFPRYCLFIL